MQNVLVKGCVFSRTFDVIEKRLTCAVLCFCKLLCVKTRPTTTLTLFAGETLPPVTAHIIQTITTLNDHRTSENYPEIYFYIKLFTYSFL